MRFVADRAIELLKSERNRIEASTCELANARLDLNKKQLQLKRVVDVLDEAIYEIHSLSRIYEPALFAELALREKYISSCSRFVDAVNARVSIFCPASELCDDHSELAHMSFLQSLDELFNTSCELMKSEFLTLNNSQKNSKIDQQSAICKMLWSRAEFHAAEAAKWRLRLRATSTDRDLQNACSNRIIQNEHLATRAQKVLNMQNELIKFITTKN